MPGLTVAFNEDLRRRLGAKTAVKRRVSMDARMAIAESRPLAGAVPLESTVEQAVSELYECWVTPGRAMKAPASLSTDDLQIVTGVFDAELRGHHREMATVYPLAPDAELLKALRPRKDVVKETMARIPGIGRPDDVEFAAAAHLRTWAAGRAPQFRNCGIDPAAAEIVFYELFAVIAERQRLMVEQREAETAAEAERKEKLQAEVEAEGADSILARAAGVLDALK